MSFQTRPWELTAVTAVNYVDGGQLLLHHRGGRVVRVTALSGWLRDRTRFVYDGFRRQRLVHPYRCGIPVSWSAVLTDWLSFVVQGGSFTLRIDSGGAPFWLVRWYALWSRPAGPPVTVGVDTAHFVTLYHGGFGLVAATTAALVIPTCFIYEEDGTLPVVPGANTTADLVIATVQLFNRCSATFVPQRWPCTDVSTRRTRQWTFFQVSPLQVLLAGW